MGNYRYITNRAFENSAGEEKGWAKIRVPNGSNTAEGMYLCPECGDQGKINQEWKRPFNVKCSKCSFLMRFPKLKGKKN